MLPLMKHLAFLVSFSFVAQAAVTLPSILTDNMVIQRDVPVHIWGRAAAGETVQVSFHGNTATAMAGDLGEWSVYLPPAAAGGPYEIKVNEVTLRDVLVGDVWVASGQSNMEFALSGVNHADTEIAAANFPRIRLLTIDRNVSTYPVHEANAKPWTPCTPGSAKAFSAVAYFFGRDVQAKTGVPIGLIHSSWGGTPVEAWTSLHALSADASLMPAFAEWSRMNDDSEQVRARREVQLKKWNDSAAAAKAAGKPAPGFPWAPNERDSWAPGGLYNAMIAPLTLFPIRGAIWYQGESNASPERAFYYANAFQTMIQDWRRAWGVGDFPFLFVQLANYNAGKNSRWPELREAQLQTLRLRNTGMASAVDIGDPGNIHPKDKQDVGARLALAARAIAYGEQIEYSGPIFRQAVRQGNAMRVFFNHAGSGLTAKGGEVSSFEIAGADHIYQPAEARIDGYTVVVSSPSVSAPVSVRYGWSDNPAGNLYNVEGLPASPFRSRNQ